MVALDQLLRELNNPYSVVCAASDVGDVDWGTLAYYHKRLGARAVVVLATRSEGSAEGAGLQPDEDPAVAATRRVLAAAGVVGADVYFLNLRQPGYARSVDDQLNLWGHADALSRIVRAFRLIRPDVVFGNAGASSGVRDQAVWRLVIEAFEAAADPKRFPETDSKVWQVRRVFQRVDQTGADVTVNLAEYDEPRGLSYAQIADAAIDRGPGNHATAGAARAFYKLVRSSAGERLEPGSSLLTNLTIPENLSRSIAPPAVAGMRLVEAINHREPLLDALTEKLIEKRAEGSTEELYQRYGVEFFRVFRFRELLQQGIGLALGLSFRVDASDNILVPGQKVSGQAILNNGSGRPLPVIFHTPSSFSEVGKIQPSTASEVITVSPGSAATHDFQYDLPQNAALTLPHSAHLYEREYYGLSSPFPESESASPFGNEIIVRAEVGLAQTSIILPALVRYDVASPVEVTITPPFALIRDWSKPREMEFSVLVRNRMPGPLAGALWVVPLAITADRYEPAHLEFQREDEEAEVSLKLKLPILKPPLAPDILIEFRREKPARPDPLASVKIAVLRSSFEIGSGVKVGWIRGANSDLSGSLAQLDIEAAEISLEALRSQEHGNAAPGTQQDCFGPSRFDSIVVDSFAYSVRSELAAVNKCLIAYVKKGGTLIVLSQRAEDWNALGSRLELAPFPIKLSCGANTGVKLLDQSHPLMARPNKITEKDFENVTASCLPVEWAAAYTSLVEPVEASATTKQSALLVGRSGDGTYVYVGLSLRDQLLAGKPNAYRLLANLISSKRTRKGWYDEW